MSDINFSKLTWENLPARTTALSATNLNRIENGIADSVNGVNSNSHSIAELQTRISQIASGSPAPVETVAEMTDESAVYLYTGSETGYTAGNWYYYNGTAWTSGGVYGGAVTSTTFTEHGVPADDFAVGEALAEKADADDVGDLSQLTTTARDNLVAAINETNEAITETNGRLTQQARYIYTNATTIEAVNGYRLNSNGKAEAKANWCCLLVPCALVFVDGSMDIQRYGLSGLSDTVFSLGYFDENLSLISARYDAIPANTNIRLNDIPENAVYIGANRYTTSGELFKLPCKSISTRIKSLEGLSADMQIIGLVTERSDNLFNRFACKLLALTTGGTVNSYNNARSVVIPLNVTDQTAVTVTRTVMSSRFTVATFSSEPAVGSSSITYRVNNSAESITIPVTAESKYLMVYFWLSSADTLTPEEILDGLMVEYGDTFTGYQEPYRLVISEETKQEIVENVQAEIDTVRDATTENLTSEIELNFASVSGYYASNKAYTTYSGVTSATVNVSEGEKYLLTTRKFGNAALACFLDANETVVDVVFESDVTGAIKDLLITIPGGTAQLLIQRFSGYMPTTLKKVVGIKNKQIRSIFDGKRITLIGDSITELNSTAYPNWSMYIGDWCGAVVQNLGASGTGFIAGTNNPYHNRISRIDTPDIIGVALSFNDMSQTIEDLTTAAETFFDDLITAYPTIPVICYVQSPWSAYHPGVEKSDQWVAAMRNICAVRGIPFYDDMYYGSALRPWLAANRAVYYMHDGEGSDGAEDWVHPNSEGHKIIARHLYPHFADNVVATGLDYLI